MKQPIGGKKCNYGRFLRNVPYRVRVTQAGAGCNCLHPLAQLFHGPLETHAAPEPHP